MKMYEPKLRSSAYLRVAYAVTIEDEKPGTAVLLPLIPAAPKKLTSTVNDPSSWGTDWFSNYE